MELRAKCTELDSQARLVESVERNMKELKLIYTRMEEEHAISQRYAKQIGAQYEEAHHRVLAFELQVKALHEQKFELELEISRKHSEVLSLRKKYEADADFQQKQYDKLHRIWAGQDDEQNSLAQQLTTARADLETANIRISFLSEKFTDLSF